MFIDKKNSSNKGFTLIELLVVVAIISLLSSIALASLTSARSKGRNAARMTAIQTLRNAFNLGLTTNGTFPSTGGTTGVPVFVCVAASCYEAWAPPVTTTNATTINTIDTFLASSLPGGQKPQDPSGGIRGRGGFLYSNPSSGINEATISYAQEGGSCGPGIGTPGSPYTPCVLYLER